MLEEMKKEIEFYLYGLGLGRYPDACSDDVRYGHAGHIFGYTSISITSADGGSQITMTMAPTAARLGRTPHPRAASTCSRRRWNRPPRKPSTASANEQIGEPGPALSYCAAFSNFSCHWARSRPASSRRLDAHLGRYSGAGISRSGSDLAGPGPSSGVARLRLGRGPLDVGRKRRKGEPGQRERPVIDQRRDDDHEEE